MHDKGNLRKELFTVAHSFRAPSIMARKAWQQELRAGGPRASTVRKLQLASVSLHTQCACVDQRTT